MDGQGNIAVRAGRYVRKGVLLALASGFDGNKFAALREAAHYTQLNVARLDNLYTLASRLVREGREGVFVECGVWKGGASYILACLARAEAKHRHVWMFDSFAGMPHPVQEDGPVVRELAGGQADGRLEPIPFNNEAPIEGVRELFYGRHSFSAQEVHICQGWFQDTLPHAAKEMGPIALLRIDADFYASTMCCLEQLYPQVAEGGYVIIDDYYHRDFPGCGKAVDEYLRRNSIPAALKRIDSEGAYFQKRGRA